MSNLFIKYIKEATSPWKLYFRYGDVAYYLNGSKRYKDVKNCFIYYTRYNLEDLISQHERMSNTLDLRWLRLKLMIELFIKRYPKCNYPFKLYVKDGKKGYYIFGAIRYSTAREEYKSYKAREFNIQYFMYKAQKLRAYSHEIWDFKDYIIDL